MTDYMDMNQYRLYRIKFTYGRENGYYVGQTVKSAVGRNYDDARKNLKAYLLSHDDTGEWKIYLNQSFYVRSNEYVRVLLPNEVELAKENGYINGKD